MNNTIVVLSLWIHEVSIIDFDAAGTHAFGYLSGSPKSRLLICSSDINIQNVYRFTAAGFLRSV